MAFIKAKEDAARYEKLRERSRAAQQKYRDELLYGGNRDKVLERDGYKCTVCGATKSLAIHHIDQNGWFKPREEKNNDIDNLITLCFKCHAKLHRELEQLERVDEHRNE